MPKLYDQIHMIRCDTRQVAVDVSQFHFQKMHPRCICDVCDFMAEHAYVIKRHMMRHNADGCRCDICGKVYKVSIFYCNINYHTYYTITG